MQDHVTAEPESRARDDRADDDQPRFEHEAVPHEPALQRLRWLADLFDDRFRLPFTNRRFGLDALLGLLPGIGDAATAVVSLYLAAESRRMGMPFTALLRMAVNVGIDLVLGAVPLLGDIFDFAWKANQRNVQLVLDHVEQHASKAERERLKDIFP